MTGNFEEIAAHALGEGRTYLMEHESKRILMDAGLETTGAHLASSADEAVRFANRLGYPVVLKVLSKDVIHKSDAGGVRLNLQDADAVRSAYDEILEAFRERGMIGVSVQRMASPGIEIIVGVTRDPTFGPVIMFGLGGIFVEILRDVSFRSIPISEEDAESMIREIKGYPLLRGYRGISGDIDAIKRMLLRVSDLVQERSIINEMDLNPVFVYPMGYTIADARIILDSSSLASSADTTRSRSADDLRGLFYPQSIAVIGASNTKGKLGWNVFYNLLTHGYAGRLYPVNPNASEVQGVRAYPSIKDVPEAADVAIVLVPASMTPQVVQDCCAAGVKYVVVESAGFAELGDEGKKIERELLSIVRRHGCRLLGPNCSGIINTNFGVVESIGVVDELNRGNVALIAQAGVYAAGYLWGLRKVLDFGIIATIGNKLDLNETDMLEAIGMDENIDMVCMYLEDVKGGRRFVDVARDVSRRKPVVVLKTGRTEAGKKAVSSHTASLAGNDQIYSAIFRQAGLIRARDNDHMFALARAFSKQPLPLNDGVFVISYAGSLGVAAADAISMNGMRLAELSAALKDELRSVLPKYVSGMNPVDFTFDQTPDQVRRTIEIAVKSEDVGSFIVVIQTEMLGAYIDTIRSIDFKGRPILAVVASKEFVIDDVIKMERSGIPVYSTPEQAAEVLGAMWMYRKEHR